nr:casein kinase 1-like protein 6 [Tanacetum cinerariifolium]
MHSRGFLHRDIKADSFIMGQGRKANQARMKAQEQDDSRFEGWCKDGSKDEDLIARISLKGLSKCKASESKIRRIQVKDIVKEVEDYFKTYSSASSAWLLSEELAGNSISNQGGTK